jgi:hypothetical protein
VTVIPRNRDLTFSVISGYWALLCALASAHLFYRWTNGLAATLSITLAYSVCLLACLYPSQLHAALESRLRGFARFTAVVLSAAAVALAASIYFFYPFLNVQTPGAGSDRDDALLLAAQALFRLEPPYAQFTYLGNTITPYPGAVLIAAPFVWLGNVAWQNLFWLAILSCLMIHRYRSNVGSLAVPTSLFILVLTPEALRETLTGGDLLTNGIYVALALWWLCDVICTPSRDRVWVAGASLLLGIAVVSRPQYALVGALAIALAYRERGLSYAARIVLLVGGSAALTLFPVWVWLGDGFYPTSILRKLDVPGLAQAKWINGFFTLTLLLLLCVKVTQKRVMWFAALLTSLPLLFMQALSLLFTGRVSLPSLGMLLNAMPFVALAWLEYRTKVGARLHSID